MCAGRIIADSDDEDDISPAPSPMRSGASSSGRGNFPRSPDPGLFRSEFHAQQEAEIYDPKSTEDTSSGRLPAGQGSAAPGTDSANAYDPWAIMSSPDSLRTTPNSKTAARSKASRTYSKKERLSSNATSPNGGASMTLPAEHATPSKISKTYSKGNTGVNDSASSFHEVIDLVSPDQRNTTRPRSKRGNDNVDDDGEAGEGSYAQSRLAKKKRISDLRVENADNNEDGCIDIPSSLDFPVTASMPPPSRRNAHDDTDINSGQVYVEASKMTSSQKGLYEEVSFPSLSSLDEPDVKRNTHLARSSGSATIAYPTPTQYRRPEPDPPSMPPLPQDLSPVASKRGSKKRRLDSLPPTAENPRSSPDVISGAPDRDGTQSDVDAEPPIVEQDNSCDEDWNEMDHGFPRSQQRQPNRKQKRQRTTKEESTEPRDDITATAGYMDDAGAQVESARPSVPKKRGRKKKEKEPDPEPVAPAAEAAQHTEDAAPHKRKRGRPRKSDKVDAAGNLPAKGLKSAKVNHGSETSHNVEDGSEEASCRDTDAKERDEQNNKEDAETDAKKEDERDADVQPKPSLSTDAGRGFVDTVGAGATSISTGEDGTSGGKREPATKAQTDTPGKTEGLLRAGTKPVYRVGLSKRSRITPLLKCIRKT